MLEAIVGAVLGSLLTLLLPPAWSRLQVWRRARRERAEKEKSRRDPIHLPGFESLNEARRALEELERSARS